MPGNPLNPASQRPAAGSSNTPAAQAPSAAPAAATDQKPRAQTRKRKGHRGGKKKRSRRKSFAALTEDSHDDMHEPSADAFYHMPSGHLSSTSIDSEALLDHREQRPMRIRRPSNTAASSSFHNIYSTAGASSRLRSMQTPNSGDEAVPPNPWDETAPLLSDSARFRHSPVEYPNYGAGDLKPAGRSRSRRASSRSSRTRLTTALGPKEAYDVNHPPSVPGSPTFGATDHPAMTFGDVMIRDEISLRSGSPHRRPVVDDQAALSVADGPIRDLRPDHNRRLKVSAAGDVCFPVPGMSELGEEDAHSRDRDLHEWRTRRRRGQWPDLSTLDEWRRFEKEDHGEGGRVKKITEPQLINGRLRPVHLF
ncbi:hypothetical protein CDD83_8132 [Cordyceps sp. RAO-2017]|nr:hypothetical protein CDD83_8132 [Cordyceps sp. RAO-2017]